ncbi:MAG: DUF4339 domain-containing protein [Lentisphaerae bacterium]|nr:DUF4339 domain-containing protein [Lentisphaerota bacterium]
MASWYYVIPKTRDKSGPHNESFVRARFVAGDITPSTLVWHDGLPNWIPAGEAFSPRQPDEAAGLLVPLPEGLRAWMGFVGVMTILVFFFPAMLLYGFPMLLTGFAILGARASLARMTLIPPDLFPFFAKLRTVFCCWGWMYIIGLFLLILSLLAYAGLALWALAPAAEGFHWPLR